MGGLNTGHSPFLEKGFQALMPECLDHAVLYRVTLRDASCLVKPLTTAKSFQYFVSWGLRRPCFIAHNLPSALFPALAHAWHPRPKRVFNLSRMPIRSPRTPKAGVR